MWESRKFEWYMYLVFYAQEMFVLVVALTVRSHDVCSLLRERRSDQPRSRRADCRRHITERWGNIDQNVQLHLLLEAQRVDVAGRDIVTDTCHYAQRSQRATGRGDLLGQAGPRLLQPQRRPLATTALLRQGADQARVHASRQCLAFTLFFDKLIQD